MVGILLVIHYITCFSMVLVILLQSGKGGGLAGAFGGGGSTIFGGRGAGTILTRATMFLGSLFFITSLTLALMSTQGASGTASSKSLIQEEARRTAGSQPAAGTPAPGGPASSGAQLPTGGAPASTPAPAPGATKTPTPGATKTPAPAATKAPAPAAGGK
jgi:preprotein translocase subunit SecG